MRKAPPFLITKVLIKLFQKFAVSKGGAFGRTRTCETPLFFAPKRAGKGEFPALAAEKRELPKKQKIGDAKSTSVFVAL